LIIPAEKGLSKAFKSNKKGRREKGMADMLSMHRRCSVKGVSKVAKRQSEDLCLLNSLPCNSSGRRGKGRKRGKGDPIFPHHEPMDLPGSGHQISSSVIG